jgi:hypothetical protein
MLSKICAPAGRGPVEGCNDFVVFATAAVTAGAAGRACDRAARRSDNRISAPLVGTVMLSLFYSGATVSWTTGLS